MSRWPNLDRGENPLPARAPGLLAGVCAGWARPLGVDPSLLRVAVAILALAWGAGAVVYALLALLMPPADVGRPPSLAETVRLNAGRLAGRAGAPPRPHGPTRAVLAVLLALGGVLLLLGSFGALAWLTPLRAVALALTAGGLALLLPRRSEEK